MNSSGPAFYRLPDVAETRQWIASVLPTKPEITGPTKIYSTYNSPPDIRVTARFQATDQQIDNLVDVVFRANLFPLLASSARIHAFLSRHCPGLVPDVLACHETDGGTYMLYRAFEGEIASQIRSLDALTATAQTLAQIQAAVANAPNLEKADLPYLPLEQIPVLFAQMLANIRERYGRVWAADDGTLTQWMPFAASEVLVRLEPMQAQIETWSQELASGPWPVTIVHGDLHTGNAIVQPDGSLLIFDWDDAVLSHPFLAVERLIVSAWALDTGGGPGPWGYVDGTVSQSAVRDAYLNAINWGTLEKRERAFDIALCLAVVKEMHHEWNWAETMGWKDGNPEWTAQLINRLCQHASRVNLPTDERCGF